MSINWKERARRRTLAKENSDRLGLVLAVVRNGVQRRFPEIGGTTTRAWKFTTAERAGRPPLTKTKDSVGIGGVPPDESYTVKAGDVEPVRWEATPAPLIPQFIIPDGTSDVD